MLSSRPCLTLIPASSCRSCFSNVRSLRHHRYRIIRCHVSRLASPFGSSDFIHLRRPLCINNNNDQLHQLTLTVDIFSLLVVAPRCCTPYRPPHHIRNHQVRKRQRRRQHDFPGRIDDLPAPIAGIRMIFVKLVVMQVELNSRTTLWTL